MTAFVARRATNKLTDRRIRAHIRSACSGANHSTKSSKLFDGAGLFLAITPAGTPVWRVKYRIGGKERLFSIGRYDSFSLEQARKETEWIRSQLHDGRDPVMARRVAKAASTTASEKTFDAVAADWLDRQKTHWSDIHYTKSKRALERDVLPLLGRLPVGEITPKMVASVIEAIARRGARDTAAKILWHCSGIFRLAQARGLCQSDPADPVREVLTRKKKQGRMPAVLSFSELGDILRRAEEAELSEVVRHAHRLCAFTAARIGNVVAADWKEFDLNASPATWTIPRSKMKARDRDHAHKIILSPEIAEELRTWQRIIGNRGCVFPSPIKDKYITRETLEKAYRVTLGLRRKHAPHGWRAAFSTLARDHGFGRDVVELALDHIHDNDVVRAYDRGERLEQRISLMKWWGKELGRAECGSDAPPPNRTGDG
jgi:integrase